MKLNLIKLERELRKVCLEETVTCDPRWRGEDERDSRMGHGGPLVVSLSPVKVLEDTKSKGEICI